MALSSMSYHVSVMEHFGVVERATPRTREQGASFRATDIGELLSLIHGETPGET